MMCQLDPLIIGAASYLVNMIGYWLTTVDFNDLGVLLMIAAALMFWYAFFRAAKQFFGRR